MRNHVRISNKLAWRIIFGVYLAAIAFGCTVLVNNAATSW